MITDAKDSVANVVTLGGMGSAMFGWNEALTLVLIVTGIVLNIVRIMAVKKKTNT